MGVLSLVAKRLGLGLVTLLVVSIIIFGAVELLPGDLAQQILGQAATPETVKALREDLGLDRPAVVRYFDWLGGAVQGDFGTSLANKRSVAEQLGPRFANTLFLAAVAAAFSIPISILLGVLAALWRDSVFDRIANVSTLTSISSPEFFLGYILILFFSVLNPWFPSISSVTVDMPFTDRVFITLLPAITLTLVVIAHMMRMTRAAIIALLASPYIEMARLKGEPRWKVIAVHAPPERARPDHQRGRAQPRLPHHRGGAGRDRVRVPGGGPAPRRQRHQAGLPGGAGLLPGVRGDLHPPQPGGRRRGNPLEPQTAASEVRGAS